MNYSKGRFWINFIRNNITNKKSFIVRQVYSFWFIEINSKINVDLDIDLSPQEIASFEFSPITSCDIEKRFP